MFGRRQIATEDDRIGALLDQAASAHRPERSSFGSGLPIKFLGACHERKKRRIGVEDRARLDIDRVLVVAVLVVDLGFKTIALVGYPVPQRAQGRRRRRADTAHQGQCSPEREPPLALARSRAGQQRRGSSPAPPPGIRDAPSKDDRETPSSRASGRRDLRPSPLRRDRSGGAARSAAPDAPDTGRHRSSSMRMTGRSGREDGAKASSSPECGVAVRRIIRRSGFRASPDRSSKRCCRPLCVPTQACASSTITKSGQARAKPSRRFSALM